MGSKRVGLARVEALIENLKRDIDLTGATRLKNPVGVETCDYSTVKSLPVAQGLTSVSFTLPANALLTDIGYVCITQLDAASSGRIEFRAGLASSTTDVIANTQINQTAADIDAGVSQSIQAGNIPHASGTAIPTFLPAVALHSTSERTLNVGLNTAGADLSDADGSVRFFIKYIIIKDV